MIVITWQGHGSSYIDKKSLKFHKFVFDLSQGIFSLKRAYLEILLPLLVKNGLIDGQKLADLHPPAHLSIKHLFMDFLFRLPISFVFETFPNFLMAYTSEIYLKASFS